ncbi:hypothetical protein [Nonomuraea dietziae]|uniref:hypothetical protein n=1 Tax=Nonomuraea dietziae TaxID=65515 RepID=UPI0031CE774C
MPDVHWNEEGHTLSAGWRSAEPPPSRLVRVDDTTKADTAYRLAREGAGLVWRGDFHNARQLLRALARRADRQPPPAGFHAYRQARATRAVLLGRLLVPLSQELTVPLRRAPDVRQACTEAYGPAEGPTLVPLTELLGVIGAHEWRRKGVEVPALGERIHPPLRRVLSRPRRVRRPGRPRPAALPHGRLRHRHGHGRAGRPAGQEGASSRSWPPISTSAPSRAPATTSRGSGCRAASR